MADWEFHSLEGLARSLDGADDFWYLDHQSAWSPGGDLGISLHLYPTADTGVVLLKSYTAGQYQYRLDILDVSGTATVRISISGDGWNWVTAEAALGALDTWHHVVAWYDHAVPSLSISVDNASPTVVTTSVPGAIYAAAGGIVIGAWDAYSGYYAGRIAHCGLWVGSYPTADQRTTLYHAGQGLTYDALPDALRTNLVAWLEGAERSGDLLDAHAGYDCTAYGAPGSAAGPDSAAALSLAHPKLPSYPLDLDRPSPVAVAQALGGRLFSEARGSDRSRLVLRWRAITAAHVASLRTWFATFGAARRPFYCDLPTGLAALGEGGRLRVRCLDPVLRVRWTDVEAHDVELTLEEDMR